jgi:DnaJ-class molecular chaperone
MPFRCPTCQGAGWLEEPGLEREKCFTCRGNGTVDPADPPHNGIFDVIWKAMFGA